MVEQIVQLLAAVLVLGAFVLSQQGRLAVDSPVFLALNCGGAGVLTVLAAMNGDVGFTLLEGVWSLYSGWRLFQVLPGAALRP
ncbi:MAG: CBU_0592 family membrane protein [Acidimicrobiia bacterium]